MQQISDMLLEMNFGCLQQYVSHLFFLVCAARRMRKVEMGSKNHEVVPTSLITQISGLRNGGVNKIIGSLAKRNLVARVQNSRCELALPASSASAS